MTGYVLTGERRYLTAYEAARQELPRAIAHLGDLVSDNPDQVDRLEEAKAIADRRGRVLQALVANVRADRPPHSRLGLLDRNKEASDALTAQLQAMQDTEQGLLAGRQAQARRTRALTLGAIGLAVALGVAGGVAAVLLFTSGVTRRATQLEGNAERLAGGSRCCRPGRAATPWARWPAAWSGRPCCSGSGSRRCARPRPCSSTSSPGARW